jgi:hypothetical protein
MRRLAFAIAVALYGSPAIAAGPELWRGTEAGMTVAQVQAAMPSATPGDGNRWRDTERLLSAKGVPIGDEVATAHFLFREGRLGVVSLAFDNLNPGIAARRSNIDRAIRLSGLVTQKYGSPYACGEKSRGNLGAFECEWRSGSLAIRLNYSDVGGDFPSMGLSYQRADATTTDNL